MSDESKDRRPLASRDTPLARKMAARLAQTSITPNQISYGSMVAAALSFACFYAFGVTALGLSGVWLILAAIFCQLRLACNLFDGMVAIEAGKQTADGAFWNEFPDRIADMLIIVGFGLAAGNITLGWAAATLAILVSYVRELGKGIDGVVDFIGPMAKPHRMALVTATCVIAALIARWLPSQTTLFLGMVVLLLGSALTVLRRGSRILRRLNLAKT